MLKVNNVYNMNCIEGLKLLDDNSVDSIVTDPPYELGFMGKKWDSTGIAYNVDVWKECFRVLKHGGHLLSFGGTRTYHRMATAIEDSGFEIRDQIQWIYGSGFPKSQNIAKEMEKRRSKVDIGLWITDRMNVLNLDKKDVAKYCEVTPRQVDHWIGTNTPCPQNPNEKRYLLLEEILQDKPWFREQFIQKRGEKLEDKVHQRSGGDDFAKQVGSKSEERVEEIFDLSTDEAKQWDGWGTALKPAHEPIVMARKPLSEKTVVQNVLFWGTGGINIDKSRVEFSENDDSRIGKGYIHSAKAGLENGSHKDNASGEDQVLHNPKGRFPANIIFDEEAGLILDEQSGISTSAKVKNVKSGYEGESIAKFVRGVSTPNNQYDDTGGASRFFYCAKASKKDRGDGNTHPTVKPIKLMEYLVRLVTPKNGIVIDPFTGSGSTLVAANNLGYDYIGFEMEKEYIRIIEKRLAN